MYGVENERSLIQTVHMRKQNNNLLESNMEIRKMTALWEVKYHTGGMHLCQILIIFTQNPVFSNFLKRRCLIDKMCLVIKE